MNNPSSIKKAHGFSRQQQLRRRGWEEIRAGIGLDYELVTALPALEGTSYELGRLLALNVLAAGWRPLPWPQGQIMPEEIERQCLRSWAAAGMASSEFSKLGLHVEFIGPGAKAFGWAPIAAGAGAG